MCIRKLKKCYQTGYRNWKSSVIILVSILVSVTQSCIVNNVYQYTGPITSITNETTNFITSPCNNTFVSCFQAIITSNAIVPTYFGKYRDK